MLELVNQSQKSNNAGCDFHTLHIRSSLLACDRKVVVYLPPNYQADTMERYPVLYLNDGQNIFEPETAFNGQYWRVGETSHSLICAGEVSPMIIVAVYNGEHCRMHEYTPTYSEKYQGGGQADRYGRMLIEELKPFIDRQYRTLPQPLFTGLGGSSLGGLVSIYLGLKYHYVFGKLAVLSPSVWWENRYINQYVESHFRKLPVRIWLDTGTDEGGTSLAEVRSLRDALLAKGWRYDVDLQYYEDHGAGHNELAWAARVEHFLRYLFPAREQIFAHYFNEDRRVA